MINKFNLKKALRDQLVVVTTANGYDIADYSDDNKPFIPDVNKMYIKENVINGDDESVGLSDDSSDFQTGLYQLIINTPKGVGLGKGDFTALQTSDVLQEAFKKGQELFQGGQKVRMITPTLKRLSDSDNYIVYSLRLKFSVIN